MHIGARFRMFRDEVMTSIDLGSAFLPNRRADKDNFLLALGVAALIDAVRLTVFPGGLLSWLIVVFLVAVAHGNRLRDAGRGPGLVIAPLALATLAKMVAAMGAVTAALYPDFLRFLEARGVDMADPVAVQAAAYDPAVQQAYQERLQSSADLVASVAQAGDWPSLWAFWIVIGLFSLWFARMGRGR